MNFVLILKNAYIKINVLFKSYSRRLCRSISMGLSGKESPLENKKNGTWFLPLKNLKSGL